jgi:hypothetical protein
MMKTASTEAAGCRIDGAQDVKKEILAEVFMARTWMLLLVAQVALNAFGAQRDDASWSKVEQLRSGQTLRVLCSDQRTWTGRLVGVSSDTLTLDVRGTERKIVRLDVVRADVKSRARSALIGLGIGAAAGAGVGYVAGSRSRLKPGEVRTAVGLGTILIAPVGAAIGALSPGWKTVYRGESSGSPQPLDHRP